MYHAKEFGARLKECREAAGMTQEELAELLHINMDYEGKLENGKRNPSVELCSQMAAVLTVSLDHLLLGKEVPTNGLKRMVQNAIRELKLLEKNLP